MKATAGWSAVLRVSATGSSKSLKPFALSAYFVATVFGDLLSLTIPDPVHSLAEDRFVITGRSYQGKLLVVVQTEQGDNIRVISARRASKRERKAYEEAS